MKTIKEIAKLYNYYQIDEIPENILADTYFSSRYQGYRREAESIVIPGGLMSVPGISVGIFAEIGEQKTNVKEEHELFYIENFYICVLADNSENLLQLMYRDKKYSLLPVYPVINKLQRNTSYEQRKPFLSVIKEPCNIGVFSTKKVLDWVQYCDEYVSACEVCNSACNDKKEANLAKIEATVKGCNGCKVERWQNRTTIITNLFRIEFELQDNGTYLSQKVEFKGTLGDIMELGL